MRKVDDRGKMKNGTQRNDTIKRNTEEHDVKMADNNGQKLQKIMLTECEL